jgi:WD40 repeat protein
LTPDPLIAGHPLVLRGHADAVTAVAVSADGALVASASRDRTVKVWRRGDGVVVHTIPGAQEQLNVVRFSRDAAQLAIGEAGFRVRLVDVKTGAVKATIAHPASVFDLAFSPDGLSLAVAGQGDIAAVYQLPEGRRRFSLEGGSVAYSGDGRRILLGRAAGEVVVVDATSGRARSSFSTASRRSWAAWSQSGSVLLSWDATEAEVRLWSPKGRALGVLPGPARTGFEAARVPRVMSMALSPDGATAVTGCGDGLVRVWDVAARVVRQTFPADNPVTVALSADATWLAVGDGPVVKLWRLGSGVSLPAARLQTPDGGAGSAGHSE